MQEVIIRPIDEISIGFNPDMNGADENSDKYHYINKKIGKRVCRKLSSGEIEVLVKNNNFAEDWGLIKVTDKFDPNLVKNCEFFGRITIGDLTNSFLEHHKLRLPVGISNSTIISCDIGDNVAIRDVHYLSHYIIGNRTILFNISEMITTNKAKFGNGIIKGDDTEQSRIWIEVSNENGGRKILPFEGMITADAYLWSKYRDDTQLMNRLKDITVAGIDLRMGYYGEVGSGCVIKNCSIIKDCNIGASAYIKGANKLKNLTILSSPDEPSQIGEGVELVNGIVGYSSKIFYGSKAIRFITGRNTQLKYGARLINSILGDNSTVSCCELLNNLIFPFHEQHHNNSFLISGTILGQSNIAAGATIGSNHNSRAADGEIRAGRGFWPGLSTDFKYNSKFASFVLVSKGSYDRELNIEYPFSLVFKEANSDKISIIPGYWFLYNMYGLVRNEFKYAARDKRFKKVQHIETGIMAPDSVGEVLNAIERIEYLYGKAENNEAGVDNMGFAETVELGRKILMNDELSANIISPVDERAAKQTGAKIVKADKGWAIYKKMLNFFAVVTIISYLSGKDGVNRARFFEQLFELKKKKLYKNWTNLGGQLIPDDELEKLKTDIKSAKINSWDSIHKRYDKLWDDYPQHKARYALFVLEVNNNISLDDDIESSWENILIEVSQTVEYIYDASYSSRNKDYTDPFRLSLYDNSEELNAVIGSIDDNDFLKELRTKLDGVLEQIESLR